MGETKRAGACWRIALAGVPMAFAIASANVNTPAMPARIAVCNRANQFGQRRRFYARGILTLLN